MPASADTQQDFIGGTLLLSALPAAVAGQRGAVITRRLVTVAGTFGRAAAGVILDTSDVDARLATEMPMSQDGTALLLTGQGNGKDRVANDVGPARLQQLFTRSGRKWQVTRAVLQIVAFSVHNLTADPPLSRMELNCRRNLTICLIAQLQKKLISVFHDALQLDGFLFLISSETFAGRGELFQPDDARHLFGPRREISQRAMAGTRSASGSFLPGWQPVLAPGSVDLGAIAQRDILDEFAPAFVSANDAAQIIHLPPQSDEFLQPPAERYINFVPRMAQADPRQGFAPCPDPRAANTTDIGAKRPLDGCRAARGSSPDCAADAGTG